MKKLVLFLISIMAVGIFGCVSLRNKPDTVVENYYNALSSADYDSAYSLICEGDKKRLKKKVLGSRRYSEIARARNNKSFAKFLSLRKYEIGETRITNNRAYVKIKIFEPTLSKDMLQEIFSERGKEELKELQTKKGLPMTTRTETVSLVKERDAWQIILPYVPPERHH